MNRVKVAFKRLEAASKRNVNSRDALATIRELFVLCVGSVPQLTVREAEPGISILKVVQQFDPNHARATNFRRVSKKSSFQREKRTAV
jgi:hypothetical protein